MNLRKPAVAGIFYPADPFELRCRIEGFLSRVVPHPIEPHALIVPHAGYAYSGPIAASAYAQLAARAGAIERVVLLGPSHHVRFRGLAATSAEAFETPLGQVPVDRRAIEAITPLPQTLILDEAHLREHSLEVQLPFLQVVLGRFQLIPLVVGDATAEETADILEQLWGGAETLVVISSDLSHYHDSATARRLDAETCRIIEARRSDLLSGDRACGCRAINGLLSVAHRRNLPVTTVDLRNSGDTAGSHDRVVGYGSWLVG